MGKFTAILLFFVLSQSLSWAGVDYGAFKGRYQLIAQDPQGICEMNWTMPMTLNPSPEDLWIRADFDNGQYFYMEYINEGKVPFDTCTIDGTIGYSETLGAGTTLQNTTVYLNPGPHCEGTSLASSHTEKWELKDNLFVLTFGETDSPRQTVCRFKKISN